MSTRSFIGIRNDDQTITGIYCHFDGYPSHTGRILLHNYDTLLKVLSLINLGDLSSLGIEVSPKVGTEHNWLNPLRDVAVAYYRDRGEDDWSGLAPRTYSNLDDVVDGSWYEYIYILDGKWNDKTGWEYTWYIGYPEWIEDADGNSRKIMGKYVELTEEICDAD